MQDRSAAPYPCDAVRRFFCPTQRRVSNCNVLTAACCYYNAAVTTATTATAVTAACCDYSDIRRVNEIITMHCGAHGINVLVQLVRGEHCGSCRSGQIRGEARSNGEYRRLLPVAFAAFAAAAATGTVTAILLLQGLPFCNGLVAVVILALRVNMSKSSLAARATKTTLPLAAVTANVKIETGDLAVRCVASRLVDGGTRSNL